MLYLLSFGLMVVVMVVGTVVQALRDEHVVVLHWPRLGYFFFEHVGDGRYTGIGWRHLPPALVRFTVLSTRESLRSLPHRVRPQTSAHRLTSAPGAKA
ncbi:MAG TPA: hypothetical protein VFL93_10640 [Longimicrobiaceae bacterium]|nr:hypothetical protein [Longimicrobiaceae bacterium]